MNLHSIVQHYAEAEHHRTGSENDRLTRDWLVRELRQRRLHSRLIEFEFPRFEAQWECRLDDSIVESLPLFYCAEGEFSFAGITAQQVQLDDWQEGKALQRIEQIACQRNQAGDAAVLIATASPAGDLYAFNVATDIRLEIPVLLIGARDYDPARVISGWLRSSRGSGRSASILAQAQPARKPRLIVTTPFSGWFRCAAERGAGIAVLLELVDRLGDTLDLQVVATSGHELHHLGVDAVQAAQPFEPQVPLLHIGSCVGALRADWVVSCNLDPAKTRVLETIFAHGPRPVRRLDRAADPAHWPGESANWVNGQRSIVSVVGVDAGFHTPADTPASVSEESITAMVDMLEATITAIFVD